MIVFPNAKINLGLFVTSKRPDGYHNLETIFLPVKKMCDALEVINHSGNEDQFTTSGIIINGSKENNLVIKALNLFRQKRTIPPLQIHLHKKNPFGAGLGGGSSDAAFMLKLLNDQYNGGFSTDELEQMASELGADCPVFIQNKTVLAKGIGNLFENLNLNLSQHWLQIVVPNIKIPTAAAYKDIIPHQPRQPLNEMIRLPLEEWKNNIYNDFEVPVFKSYPKIRVIKETLYQNGAIYASMSGSGSSVYGIFKEKPKDDWTDSFTVHTEEIS
ncbi:4-(cytidine 5'-diphospho)-2-C-methyl-D-erythritol kinase [Geofilum sp. OHC36d9]|uniref:4-(cytidine 5'-diphospho)-2-C-methyl-D-erythritol kinase n=1 Tax=Geofilum sp. OHC36d9 TaxID=3458413 RepID=UPI004034DC1C